MKAVKKVLSSVTTGVIAISTGNSSPLFRSAGSSMRLPRMCAGPPAFILSMPAACAALWRSGTINSPSSVPSASLRSKPKICSAAELNATIRPSMSMVTMASRAASSIADFCDSLVLIFAASARVS